MMGTHPPLKPNGQQRVNHRQPVENQRSRGSLKNGFITFDGHPHAAPGLRKVVPNCHVLGAPVVPNCERIGLPRKAAVKIRILHVLEQVAQQRPTLTGR